MTHPPGNYRCPLGRLQPPVTDLEDVKRTGWREQHVLVVVAARLNHRGLTGGRPRG